MTEPLINPCLCACCDHGEGSDCACDCHAHGLCAFPPSLSTEDLEVRLGRRARHEERYGRLALEGETI